MESKAKGKSEGLIISRTTSYKCVDITAGLYLEAASKSSFLHHIVLVRITDHFSPVFQRFRV